MAGNWRLVRKNGEWLEIGLKNRWEVAPKTDGRWDIEMAGININYINNITTQSAAAVVSGCVHNYD